MPLLKQSSTAQPLIFLMIDSTDHITGKTGLTCTVTLSKAGAAFASPAGAVTEIGSGWYKVAGNATDTNTLGPLVLHATATGADPVDVTFDVVAFDPQVANLAANVIQWNSTNVATPDTAGYPKVTSKVGTGTGEINLSSGKAPATIAAGDIATDAITAASVKADAVTKIQSGLSTLTAGAAMTLTSGERNSVAAALLATVIDGTLTMNQVMTAIAAFQNGKVTITDNGDGTSTATFYKRDGSTTAFTTTYATASGARATTGTNP